METWVQMIVVSGATVIASSGFWAWIMKRDATQSATAKLLMGLAYDKISDRGIAFIERGWITKDEYEDFRKYLYEPYKELGGNGVAERIMLEVSGLPWRAGSRYGEIVKAKRANKENEDE